MTPIELAVAKVASLLSSTGLKHTIGLVLGKKKQTNSISQHIENEKKLKEANKERSSLFNKVRAEQLKKITKESLSEAENSLRKLIKSNKSRTSLLVADGPKKKRVYKKRPKKK